MSKNINSASIPIKDSDSHKDHIDSRSVRIEMGERTKRGRHANLRREGLNSELRRQIRSHAAYQCRKARRKARNGGRSTALALALVRSHR